MDLRIVASTFGTIFIAELGDKTQLATLALASDGRSRLAVFLGAALALVLNSAIGVLAGASLSQVVPALWVRRAAGLLFVVLGLFYLVRE